MIQRCDKCKKYFASELYEEIEEGVYSYKQYCDDCVDTMYPEFQNRIAS